MFDCLHVYPSVYLYVCMSEYLSECLCVCEFDCLNVYLSVCLPDPDFTVSSSLTLCAFLFLLLTSHLLVSSNTISLLSCSLLNHPYTNLFYHTLLTTSDHDTFFFFFFLSYLFETAFAVKIFTFLLHIFIPISIVFLIL